MTPRKAKLADPTPGITEVFGALMPHGMSFALEPSFPGVFLMISESLDIVGMSKDSEQLAEAFMDIGSGVAELAEMALGQGKICHRKQHLTMADGSRRLDLFAIPLAGPRQTLLIAHDTTPEHNLIAALFESRQLFKDLVFCSSDFSWETDGDGRFRYVSPKCALGFAAIDLIGRPARDLIAHPADAALVFETRDMINSQELWLHSASGEKVCVSLSAVPKLGHSGEWLGARGVCRDITRLKRQEISLAKAHARERVMMNIVGAMTGLQTGDAILAQIAGYIAEAVPGALCYITRDGAAGRHWIPEPDPGLDGPMNIFMTSLDQELGAATPALPTKSKDIIIDDLHDLALRTGYRHQPNGGIVLVRRHGNEPFSDEAHAILDEAGEHVGIAIEQIATHERLEMLARTDELTGLLNRRAFMQDVERRLGQQGPTRLSALLYLDLDHLKAVNDQLGHGTGDYVIASFAREIRSLAREHDIAARIGGDEFLLWLDATSRPEALAAGRRLIEFAGSLRAAIGPTDPALGLSAGITLVGADRDVKVQTLMQRADKALYKAKKNGKSTAILSEDESHRGTGRNRP